MVQGPDLLAERDFIGKANHVRAVHYPELNYLRGYLAGLNNLAAQILKEFLKDWGVYPQSW
ncbi:unnamed protein product [marine sediment metagenome]|uniref:Uncharacterized protein n=1 Tax=marine sediment metagenome TaxID=412755 RepID=X1U5V4_9ZZZZ